MLSAITKPTELIVDIQLEQCKNPDGTIQIFYRKSDGVLYAVNGSAAKLQDGEAIAICSESAQIAAATLLRKHLPASSEYPRNSGRYHL